MNIFQTIFIDVVLLSFPILVYLIYLSTNENINPKSKKIYLELAMFTSFFILYRFGLDNPKLIPFLVLNSLVILSFIMDNYILANIFSIIIILIYFNVLNNTVFMCITYIFINIFYLFKKKFNIKNILFIEIFILFNSLNYIIWIKKYNADYYNLNNIFQIIICYFLITNILCFIFETGKNIINTNLTLKELRKEKQIRLSLFKITHEIKNPIAVCKGYLDMINVYDKSQVERYIPIIKSEIERLLSLLQDFLLINKNNLDMDIMDFNMLIEDTIEKLHPLLKNNNIKLNLNLIDDEIFINGDYNRLSQVIINIIKNSIEAIEDRGIININSKIKGNRYILTIEDNGLGMTKDTLSKIREPFFTTKKRGSGLGVSLISEIVEAHNGKINYESEYMKGTKVTITIPIYE